jgi:copper homeostasis protein
MNTPLFELCVESLEASLAAQAGGASRVELCSELACGGTTPDPALLAAVCQAIRIPVYVLIRPHAAHFVFNGEEFREMQAQIETARRLGAAGIVTGILCPGGRVDVERSRQLIEQARPMAATFHRAFDETPDLFEALEDVIHCGADYLLTSGGAEDVLSGVDRIAALERRAAGRIRIMAGGGLRLENVIEILSRSGISALHGSLQRRSSPSPQNCAALTEEIAADLREVMRRMNLAASTFPASRT